MNHRYRSPKNIIRQPERQKKKMEEPTKRVTRVNRGQNMKRHIEELLSNDVKYFSSQSTESTNKNKGSRKM